MQLRNIIDEFDDNVYIKGMVFSGERVPTKQQKDKERKNVIAKVLAGEINTFFVQDAPEINLPLPLSYQTPTKLAVSPEDRPQRKDKLIAKLRKILTRTKREFDDEDE